MRSKWNRCNLTVKEIVLFGMLGGIMFASKVALAAIPNVHLIGVFIVAMTVVFRYKALYPIYVYVLLEGIFYGFSVWWIPYLYIWAILWGATMLLPKKMPKFLAPVVYIVICGLHGFLFGTLYAPMYALLLGFDFKTTIAWIAAGFPFDAIHGIGNLVGGVLILPMVKLFRQADRLGRA